MTPNRNDAMLKRGTYRDGYGRPEHDRHYYTVVCLTCHTILNSGHHYHEDERHLAEAAAARHTCEGAR